MIDFEQRVRTGLSGLADAVPPSEAARAELTRRLTTRRRTSRHGPVLAAAAAAVVVAGVAIPVLTQRGDEHRVPSGPPVMASDLTATEPTTTAGTPVSGVYRVRVPFVGGDWQVVVYLRDGKIPSVVCMYPAATDPPADVSVEECAAPPPVQPDGGPPSKVRSMAVFDSHPSGGRLLFLTTPDVATLEAGAADGSPVDVRLVVRHEGFALFAADFGASSAGFRYTAKDASGHVVESGIS